MDKICNTCNTTKPLSYFRNRNQCKVCENKHRYERKKLQRMDPLYDKKCKEYDVKRKRKKEKENELTGFIQKIRQSVRKSFKRSGYTKKSKTYNILGNDWGTVKEHFELLFQPGMSWNNYGDWEIDHIIPLSKAKNEDDVIKLCNYTNLQPLWKLDNRLKGG
jgi:hypothetical protein